MGQEPYWYADTEKSLCELFTWPNQSGLNTDSDIERAVVLSGMTERELQQILGNYRGAGLPRPLWATLTPFSENWPLSNLLDELKKERSAMERNRKQRLYRACSTFTAPGWCGSVC